MRLTSATRTTRLISALLTLSAFCHSQDRKSRDWLTWGGDAERTSWSRNETTISRTNVENLDLKWKTQIDKEVPIDIESGAAMLTAPLFVKNVKTSRGSKNLVFTLAASNTLAALDAESGAIVWQRTFTNKVPPPAKATWVCTNTPTATPVIDKPKGAIDLISADGVLHVVSLADGEDKMPPVDFVPPYSRNWSLNLIDGCLYTTVGRGCGGTPSSQMASTMMAMDLNEPAHPVIRFVTSAGRPGGAWGRAGMVWGFHSLFIQTADGAWDPSGNKWGQTLLKLSPKILKLEDYFTPPNLDWINEKDLDFGSGGPVTFTYDNLEIVAAAGKDGTIYLLDAKLLGGADHRTPLFSLKAGNEAELYERNGVWGAMATYADSKNNRWIYVPMWGPPAKDVSFGRANGDAPDGSMMAFKVAMENQKPKLVPMWVSRNLAVPDPPVIANALVFAISTGENTLQRHTNPRYQQLYRKPSDPPLSTRGILTAEERRQQTTHTILYAFNAETGEELFSSKDKIDDWTHLSSVTVANGQVYVTTRKSIVYAFGLKKK
jgi:outer membrane protein assembly factor BamB